MCLLVYASLSLPIYIIYIYLSLSLPLSLSVFLSFFFLSFFLSFLSFFFSFFSFFLFSFVLSCSYHAGSCRQRTREISALLKPASCKAVWAFMFYIALVALAVLNVVTAVLPSCSWKHRFVHMRLTLCCASVFRFMCVAFAMLIAGWRFVEYAMKMAAEDRDLVIQDYLEKESKFSKAGGGSLSKRYESGTSCTWAKDKVCL